MLILSIKLISNLLFDVDVSGNGFDMSRQLMKFINWGCGAFIDDTGVIYKMIIFCKYGVGSGKGGGGGGAGDVNLGLRSGQNGLPSGCFGFPFDRLLSYLLSLKKN